MPVVEGLKEVLRGERMENEVKDSVVGDNGSVI